MIKEKKKSYTRECWKHYYFSDAFRIICVAATYFIIESIFFNGYSINLQLFAILNKWIIRLVSILYSFIGFLYGNFRPIQIFLSFGILKCITGLWIYKLLSKDLDYKIANRKGKNWNHREHNLSVIQFGKKN